MVSLPKLHHSHLTPHLSLNLHCSSFPTTPLSSLSFRSLPLAASPPLLSSSSSRLSSIRASSSPSPSTNDPYFGKPTNTFSRLLQTLNPLFSPLVETACIAIAATAFFFMRFHLKPAIAVPLAPPASTVESTAEESKENLSNEEKQRIVEEKLRNNPSDADALRSLLELKLLERKLDEAVGVIERLIEVEPEELEWPLLKANMCVYNDDHELAKQLFEDVLKKDPFRVEAYHGLVMATSESDGSVKGLLKRVEEAADLCKKQKGLSEARDFKLLLAQIKVMEGDLSAALKAYQELVKEEPRDFRPYLCQGIIYTLLRKKDEAEKQFEEFRKLVPQNHPFKEYIEDTLSIGKFSLDKLERERAGARS